MKIVTLFVLKILDVVVAVDVDAVVVVVAQVSECIRAEPAREDWSEV